MGYAVSAPAAYSHASGGYVGPGMEVSDTCLGHYSRIPIHSIHSIPLHPTPYTLLSQAPPLSLSAEDSPVPVSYIFWLITFR
jgi:hypothetical protein